MINALHSSQVSGTKNFTLDGQNFEWQAIIDMFERECQRVRDSNARMIPKLREAHSIRDSWIKLNVTPAKIMQVRIIPTQRYCPRRFCTAGTGTWRIVSLCEPANTTSRCSTSAVYS